MSGTPAPSGSSLKFESKVTKWCNDSNPAHGSNKAIMWWPSFGVKTENIMDLSELSKKLPGSAANNELLWFPVACKAVQNKHLIFRFRKRTHVVVPRYVSRSLLVGVYTPKDGER